MSPASDSTRTHEAVGPLLGRWFDSLSASSVRWLVLRGRDDLVDPTGDVDLLVHPVDLSRAMHLATEVGFLRRSAWGRRPHRFMAGYDPVLDRMVELDLVDEIAFGTYHELATGVTADVLTRRVTVGGVPVPDPTDAAWLDLLHLLLDKPHLPAERLRQLVGPMRTGPGGETRPNRLRQLVGPTHTGPVGQLLPENLRRQVAICLLSGNLTGLTGLRTEITGALSQGAGPRIRRTWRRSIRTTVKLQKATVRRGPTLALLGPDGAGKSTLIADLGRTCDPRPRTEYMGVYPRSRDNRSTLPGIRFLATVGRLWTAQARAGVTRRRGRAVIFDRHPLEALYVGPPTSVRGRLRRRLLSRTVPRPDHVVVLDAPVEELLRRKPEHSPDRTAEMRESYLRLAGSVGARVVDTTAGPENTRRAVLTELYRPGHRRGPR